MTPKTQPSIVEIELVVRSVVKRGIYKGVPDSDPDCYWVHIAIIGNEVRMSDLKEVFAPYSELKEVWLSNIIPCFGFAVYKDKEDTAVAVKACNGVEV